MKILMTLVLLTAAAIPTIGCEASGRISDDDRDSSKTTYQKRTTYDNGDKTVTTEKRTESY